MTFHTLSSDDDLSVVHHLPAAGSTIGHVPPAPKSPEGHNCSAVVADERTEGVNLAQHEEGGTPAPLTSLAMMRLGILSALDQIEAAEEANDYGALAVGALAAKSLRGDLSLIEREAKQACRRVLDAVEAERRTEVPLPGHSLTLERDSAVKRTQWRTDDLFFEVCRRAMYDSETGELMDQRDQAGNLALRVLYCFSLTPKVTGLRALGIDPSDYCVEAREASVKITGGLS